MAISLRKGQNVSLSKEAPGLKQVRFGLGWDARQTDGAPFDLDASAFVLDSAGRVLSDDHFVFYNNKTDPNRAVSLSGDNRTGHNGDDDEYITVNLSALPANVAKIALVVTIYDADVRRQNFGQVRNAYVRAVNMANHQEIARYNLSEEASTATALVFAELRRQGAEWQFHAVGEGDKGGLAALARGYGVNLG